VRRSMKAAIQCYKRELQKHLQLFLDLNQIGVEAIYVSQEERFTFMSREMRLEGMQQVLGITDADKKRIYSELGPQYEACLKYEMILASKNRR